MKAKAAVCYKPQAPLKLETVELDEPRNNEVLVRVEACGVCHTDLIAPGVLTEIPIVLGHEGSGVIEKVGPDVTSLAVGDSVVMSFGSCTVCPPCADHKPFNCRDFAPINFGGVRPLGAKPIEANGVPLHGAFFQQSSFATYALANETNVVKVNEDVPLELLGPLGCGFSTGAGAVMNSLNATQGSSIVIFGAGSVGLSAVMGAVIRECSIIVAVDINEDRLVLARELGATHTINPSKEDTVGLVKEITSGGANYSLETSGAVSAFNDAVACLDCGGICGIVAITNGGAPFEFSTLNLLVGAATLVGIRQGGTDPQKYIPELIALYQAGKFPIDKLVTYFPFDQINKAIEQTNSGKVVKAILKMR